MWSNIPAKDASNIPACLKLVVSLPPCSTSLVEGGFLFSTVSQTMGPEYRQKGNRGTCWQGQEWIFWKLCLLMEWEGKGRLGGIGAFQKSNRRLQV